MNNLAENQRLQIREVPHEDLPHPNSVRGWSNGMWFPLQDPPLVLPNGALG